MRECHRNYAHGPLVLEIREVESEYKGKKFICQKSVYACRKCDFTLHLQWMQDKYEKDLKVAYQKRYGF